MNRQGGTFAVLFILTLAALVPCVYLGLTWWAVSAGVVGILVHWVVSHRSSRNEEVADASYFFGFLLTLVFLIVGLYKLGQVPSGGTTVGSGTVVPGAASAGTNTSRDVMGFLEDLAAGLALTIVGLLVRQIRTLGGATHDRASGEPSVGDLTAKLDSVIDIWRERPEHKILEALEQSHRLTETASEEFRRQIRDDTRRLKAAITVLDKTATDAVETMTRTGSQLANSFQDAVERLRVEATNLLETLKEQREASDKCFKDTLQTAEKLRLSSEQSLHEHLVEWRRLIDVARTKLNEAHQSLDVDYATGLKRFAESGEALAALTKKVLDQVQALPNPTERLQELWTSVAKLEATLRTAVSGSATQFDDMRARTGLLAGSLTEFQGVVNGAAKTLESGTKEMADELERELTQMSGLIDEYLGIMRKSANAIR
jgi:hypothetical protein